MVKTIVAVGIGIVVLGAAVATWHLVIREADRRLNPITARPPYEVGPRAHALHERLFVADMHSDFLLWRRDLSERYRRGHVDLPRLIEGNVGLQVFSVVTKSPWGQNYTANKDDSDRITVLAVAQIWPIRSWGSLLERALFQARRLHAAEEAGDVAILRTATDLDVYLDKGGRGSNPLAALLAIEGLHVLEGRLANVDTLFAAGFRMMAPVHMFDNAVGGSAQGVQQGGLTDLGVQVVRRLAELGVIVDLAHASDETIRMVVEMSARPVVVSHTGVRGTCDSPRNLSDEQLRAIAGTGGVIGIGFWDRAVCGAAASDIARAIRHAADVVGVEHVGLGSDFDGTVQTPFDVSGMALITEALLERGFDEGEIESIMGGNVLRVFREVLPAGGVHSSNEALSANGASFRIP